MSAPTATRFPFPGFNLADQLPRGGWVKRATVPASKMPHAGDGEHYPCPTNGHLTLGVRHLACTKHQPGRHVAASLGRVLAVWEDTTVDGAP